MADPDLLAPFDPAAVAAVAADRGVDAAALRERLRAHQRTARSVRDVDGLVYEYRRAFPGEVVRERTPAAYYLSVPERVWGEFEADAGDAERADAPDDDGEADEDESDDADALGAERAAAEAGAVRAVHERTVAAAVDEGSDEPTPDDGVGAGERREGEPRAPMVLVRE